MVGPNGAGKTTLFNSLSGAHRLTSGRISFRGQNITRLPAHDICRCGMGRTFQIPQSLNQMTVLVGSMFREHNMRKARRNAEDIVAFCGLEWYRDEKVGRMNVIQKKRVEIARALATRPALLLLDETMAGLTAAERKEAVEFIRSINRMGITIIIVEQNVTQTLQMCDYAYVIKNGKTVIDGTGASMLSSDDVRTAYLGL